MRTTLKEFATAGASTRLWVYSDGIEHAAAGQSATGQSFYDKAGLPRSISVEAELRKLELVPVARGAVRLLWYGLLATPEAKYVSSAMLEGYLQFWAQALTHWGVGVVQIGPTLNNPDGSFARLAPPPQ